MREFHIEERKVFTTGLRTYHKMRRGQTQFYDLYNFKPTKEGLVSYEEMVVPIPIDVIYSMGLPDESFPFPQLFIGKEGAFVCGSQRIFFFNPLDWSTPYELTTYDATDTSNTKVIPAGNSWQFFDFWDTFFFVNGSCVVFGSAKDTMLGNDYKVYVHDGVPISACTEHLGRALFGGFTPDQFWDSTWNTFWLEWYDKNQDVGIDPYDNIQGSDILMPVKENWIWWSSVGGADALMMFFPSLMQTGFISSSYGSTKPMILDLLKKNEQGFAPMPVNGTVLATKNIGDHVIVYSTNGVTAIKPVVSPIPTYSITKLYDGGLANRNAVDGNDFHHVFVDSSGMLVRITGNLEVLPLGYREFFYPMLGSDLAVSFAENFQNNDPFGEFFISSSSENFYLGASGLNEHWQQVKSAKYFQGATVGMGDLEPANTTKNQGRFGLEGFDIGLVSGKKTLEWVRVIFDETWYDSNEQHTLQVSIGYRYSVKNDESWSYTSYKRVNKEGWVYFPVEALDHRVRIKVDEYDRAAIDSIKVGFKQGDRRYKRSISLDSVKTR